MDRGKLLQKHRFSGIILYCILHFIVSLTGHEGRIAYRLRIVHSRFVCTNGLIGSLGAFPAYCITHRGNNHALA